MALKFKVKYKFLFTNVCLLSFTPRYSSFWNVCPPPFRMTCLAAVCLTQAWMMWKFINFQLKKWREHSQNQASKKKAVSPKSKPHKREPARGELASHCCVRFYIVFPPLVFLLVYFINSFFQFTHLPVAALVSFTSHLTVFLDVATKSL